MTPSELPPQAGTSVLAKVQSTLARETKYKPRDCKKNLFNSLTDRILFGQMKNQTTIYQPILERLKFKFLNISFTKIYLKERNCPKDNYISIPFNHLKVGYPVKRKPLLH